MIFDLKDARLSKLSLSFELSSPLFVKSDGMDQYSACCRLSELSLSLKLSHHQFITSVDVAEVTIKTTYSLILLREQILVHLGNPKKAGDLP